MRPARLVLAAVFVILGIATTAASSDPDGSEDLCGRFGGGGPPPAAPAPPVSPDYRIEEPVPKPRVIAQELSVAPGADVARIEPNVLLDTPCGSRHFSRITFSNGETFLLESGVESVDPSPTHPPESGNFLARFGR